LGLDGGGALALFAENSRGRDARGLGIVVPANRWVSVYFNADLASNAFDLRVSCDGYYRELVQQPFAGEVVPWPPFCPGATNTIFKATHVHFGVTMPIAPTGALAWLLDDAAFQLAD
jgi:hypothetical protein